MVQMFRGTTVLGLLFQLFAVGFGQLRSPCPNIFNYALNESSGETRGRIIIQEPPMGRALHIKVELSIAITLPTKYVGRLELAESREEAVRAVEQGGPLVYRLHFPLHDPIPLVTRIIFNNQTYCSGRRAIGSIITSITLEHTLYPPGVPHWEFQNMTPLPNKNISLTTIDDVPPRDSGMFNECGRPLRSDVNLLVANGEKTSRGDWPWLVAIHVARVNLEFQCAGSLISTRHVLTAAHCLKRNDIQLPASTLLAVLGRYRLKNWTEKGSVTYEVSGFKIHPDYGRHGNAYNNDIAIMVLIETVTYSKLIQPICLWSGPSQIESVVGLTGVVVGWGRDEYGNAVVPEPRMARVSIVSQEDCLRSNADFVQITSNRTFCAGTRDGTGPCNGDSGAGLAIHDPRTQRYHLRGIVSLSLLDKSKLGCDLTQYVVYTDTAKYHEWIQQQVAAI